MELLSGFRSPIHMLLAVAHDHLQPSGFGLQRVQPPVAWAADQLCPSTFAFTGGNFHYIRFAADPGISRPLPTAGRVSLTGL